MQDNIYKRLKDRGLIVPDASPFYLWQLENYGTTRIDLDKPADVYRDRAMPTTPRGDFICALPQAQLARELFPLIDGKTAEEAREIAAEFLRTNANA